METSFQHIEPSAKIKRLRLRRGVHRLVTRILVVLMAVAGVFGFFSLLIVLSEGFTDDVFVQSGLILTPVLLWFIVRRLRSGPRPQILYLRGFKRIGTEEVVTLGATGAMGRDYRLITLDDAKLPPVGVPKRARRRAWLIGVIGLLVLGLSVLFGWTWLRSGIEAGIDMGFQAGMDSAGEGFMEAIGGVFAGFILAIVFGLFIGMLAIIPAVILGLLGVQAGLFSIGTVLAMHRAESRKRFTIDTADDLATFRTRLLRTRQKRWSPRLLVVRVRDKLWKRVVRDVGSDCLATLMDLSHPSEGLYWEVVHFFEKEPRPCVLVADEDSFRSWFEKDCDDPLHRRFQDLLKNVTVIPVSATNPKGERQFQQSVRSALDRVYLEASG